MAFRYKFAVVCRVSNSFKDLGSERAPIDIQVAKFQHEQFVESLRRMRCHVLEMEPDEKHPMGLYVDDCAIFINGVALICRPKDHRRLGEVAAVRAVLKNDLRLRLAEVDNEKALLEGGDVLFTGKEIIVGLSARTNELGAQQVAKNFLDYPCTIIKVAPEYPCLKAAMSVGGDGVLIVSKSKPAQDMLRQMYINGSFYYDVIYVDEDAASNVIYCNGILLHTHSDEIPSSIGILENKLDNRMQTPCSELRKGRGQLSSCALLIGKPNQKSIPTVLDDVDLFVK